MTSLADPTSDPPPSQGETKTKNVDEDDVVEEEDSNYVVSEKKTVAELMEDKEGEDEAMKKYKESLLGVNTLTNNNDPNAAPVEIIELRLLFVGRDPLIIPLGKQMGDNTAAVVHLKENEQYVCQLVFAVNKEIVSGLKFLRQVYRSGIRVDKEQIMVGSYAPTATPIVFKLEEDIVPGGMLARATYRSKIKLIDEDKTVHAQVEYAFKIVKKWPTTK